MTGKDTTDIPGLVTFELLVVLDVFSRMPLAWRVFSKEPAAVQVATLVEDVARGPGADTYLESAEAYLDCGVADDTSQRR